jgi:hypothetical protein
MSIQPTEEIIVPLTKGNCLQCRFVRTCDFVDRVQAQMLPCPLVSGVHVAIKDTSIVCGQVREARRRWAIYQRMGINVITNIKHIDDRTLVRVQGGETYYVHSEA